MPFGFFSFTLQTRTRNRANPTPSSTLGALIILGMSGVLPRSSAWAPTVRLERRGFDRQLDVHARKEAHLCSQVYL